MWCVAIPVLLVLYILFDVNYFIRIAVTIGLGRLFSKKSKVTDVSTIYGFCTTQDVDIFLRHMNNARYIRELDFARFSFYDLTGIFTEIRKRKGDALQGATSVRYRKTIPIFTPYKINTKIIYWDDKAIYLEQTYVTFDGFVRAIILSKQNIVKVDVPDMMKKLTGSADPGKMPEELDSWLRSVETSSAKLRADAPASSSASPKGKSKSKKQ